MNKIWQLFQVDFVLDLFRREILPQYPTFVSINRLEIRPYKKLVWDTTYHVVIGYQVYFGDRAGREISLPLVCSAHSDEPRENIFRALQYLQARHFATAEFTVPRPLYYSSEFRGTFYRGLVGKNLLHYLIADDRDLIRRQIKLAAGLLARLHGLAVGPEADFNPVNGRIATVIPGVEATLQEMRRRYGEDCAQDLRQVYARLIAGEEESLRFLPRLALIHGDAHPENFIITRPNQIGLIDFTDFCLGDPARDLGTFLQQLDYKYNNKKPSETGFVKELREIFLANYLAAGQQSLTPALEARIDLYYNWTAIRTAVYWFLKSDHNENRGRELLERVKNNLALASQ
jgi:thiamine kinase-like enzyme